MKMNELRESLAALLEKPEWNQTVLAERSGVKQSTISRILNGQYRRGCGVDTLEKLLPFVVPLCIDQSPTGEGARQ